MNLTDCTNPNYEDAVSVVSNNSSFLCPLKSVIEKLAENLTIAFLAFGLVRNHRSLCQRIRLSVRLATFLQTSRLSCLIIETFLSNFVS